MIDEITLLYLSACVGITALYPLAEEKLLITTKYSLLFS